MAQVYVSDIIDVSIDQVWPYARDFNGHAEWHPVIAESFIEDNKASDQVGCIRNFKLMDGGHLRETLLALDDRNHTLVYDIIVSPMPITNYIATFRCTPISERNATLVEWMASFDVAPDDEAAVIEKVGRNTFAVGITALGERLRS